ncbi:caspase family protein [Streptomyces chartreusis]|uniref:wHTH domain-containing protein n=1 Tax=Streptomyces chartreusis TaxID=1969 RepID=UPI0037030BFC
MHRALLLFVDRYESTEWQNLEFLTKEYDGVKTALSGHGYRIDQQSACGELDASTLNQRIERFISEARHGDNLLVFLSGHGYHADRAHWFAAHDSNLTGKQTMRVTNVRLDEGWPDLVEASTAKQVLFVIDACRDRLVDPTDSYHLPAVSPPDGSERLSYLMACPPEQPAVYLTPNSVPSETFSLFTQAFRDVLSNVDGNLTVDALRRMMEEVMEDLRSHHSSGALAQIPRLSGEEGSIRFPVLLDRDLASTKHLAINNRAWQMTPSGYARDRAQNEVQLVCSHLDENFLEERRLLSSDPWLDWEAYSRASKSIETLTAYLTDGFEFTPAEVAVLVLSPHLYHGFRVHLARQVDQILSRSFEALAGSDEAWSPYPRLQRQTESRLGSQRGRRDRKVADAWVLHQNLARPGDAHKHQDALLNYLDAALAGTDEVAEILTKDTVSWLFRAMFYGGSTLAEDPDFSSPEQGLIRYQLIGYILAASQAMALDISELPPVLVEHSGGKDRVSFLEIRETVRKARWQASGRTLRLEARCSHQAVMVALQERSESLDGLLYTATRIEGLEKLPNRASGDAVGPEEDTQTGRLKFLPVATRFGLDGTRVRDLLAGEQLYSDRSLAIRELYQNALDACNVRNARETFRPSGDQGKWVGRIDIRQGSSGTTQFVECIDNGSGMGRGELLHAFAQGGVRLSHLMDFQEEKLQWRRKGIKFHENSRFGIGVLSYFMLADEIEVVTCKFHRDRSRGRVLRVTITGPDNLFHVEESTEEIDFLGDPCGSRIRLYLRSDVHDFSCVTALRPVLGVAKYTTFATNEDECETWNPITYVSRAGSFDQGRIDASGSVVADPSGEVFWCEHGGALLVDGISVEGSWGIPAHRTSTEDRPNAMKIPGAVVNLSGAVVITEGQGKRVPRLTVDRNQIIDDVSRPVEKRLRAAARSLMSADFLTSRWLEKAATTEPRLADVIVEGLIDFNATLAFDDGFAPMRRTGYLPGDEAIRANWQRSNPIDRDLSPIEFMIGVPQASSLPPHLSLWRHAAHFPDEVKQCLGDMCPMDWDETVLRPALPSDAVVLGGSMIADAMQQWDVRSNLGRVLRSSRKLHRDLPAVIRQIEALGQPVPFASRALSLPQSVLYSLLGAQFEATAHQVFGPVRGFSPISFIEACHAAKVSASEAINILTDFGFDVSHFRTLERPDSEASKLAKVLLSERFDGKAPWFAGSFGSQRIVAASKKLGLSIGEIAVAYKQLGYTPATDAYGTTDHRLYSSLSSSCVRSRKARLADIIKAAHTTGESIRATANRIQALGIEIAAELPRTLPDSASLLMQSSGLYRKLDPSRPVSLPELNFLANRKGISMELIAQMLRGLEFEVPFERYPENLTEEDVSLLAKGFETSDYGAKGWLNPTVKVPLAHILLAATFYQSSPRDISDRLAALGMRVPDLPAEPPQISFGYREFSILRDWIPYGQRQTMPLGVVMWFAMKRGGSLPENVEFLKSLGFIVDAALGGLELVADVEAALLRSVGEYGTNGISFTDRVATEAVVHAAEVANVSVREARSRLVELGVRISHPGTTGSHHHYDGDLFRALSSDIKFVPAALVIAVSDRCSRSPFDVSMRLEAAGFTVQSFEYPRDRANHRDLIMLRDKAAERGSFIDVTNPVGLEHLLLAAHRLGCSVRDVAVRLSILGMTVPDVQEMISNAWRLVPKQAAIGE